MEESKKKKKYWWTYLQGRNRDTGIENGLVDTWQEGQGGMNWESSIAIYASSMCETDSEWETAVETRELSLAFCTDPEGWDGRVGGREAQEKGAYVSI